jgi:polypyrimidine tract-binding protein 1
VFCFASCSGKAVYFQYSSREEISAPSAAETPNNILLITVLNILYPVTIDVLQRVFEKYGPMQKIIIFSKSGKFSLSANVLHLCLLLHTTSNSALKCSVSCSTGTFQSLLQYSDVASAIAAKRELDGQNIYAGCCTLRLQYSSLTNLNVKYNNEKSRDFTNPSLPSGPAGGAGMGSVDPVASGLAGMYADPTQMAWGAWGMPQPATMGYPGTSYGAVTTTKSTGGGGGSSSVLIVSGLDEQVSFFLSLSLSFSLFLSLSLSLSLVTYYHPIDSYVSLTLNQDHPA